MKDVDIEGAKALQNYFASCSLIISSESPGFKYGTGVAVRHRDQKYILTAAHVLRGEPSNEKLLFVGRPDCTLKEVEKEEIPDAFFRGIHGPIKSSTGTHISISGRVADETQGDIAALKVTDIDNALPHTIFHDLTEQLNPDISIGMSVVICGFPSELALHAQHRPTGKPHRAMFTAYAWQTILPLPESLDESNPMDATTDFVTDFVLDEAWDPVA